MKKTIEIAVMIMYILDPSHLPLKTFSNIKSLAINLMVLFGKLLKNY